MRLTYDRDRVFTAIDAIVKKTMMMDLTWDWPCGVAMYGVTRAYEATGKREYIDAVQKWVDDYIALGLPAWTVNTCAMGHCLLTLYEVTGEQRYRDIIMSKIDYLRNHAFRFGEHVLQHTVSVNNDFPEQAWADTLFMAAYFMLRVGRKFEDESLIDDALNQYDWHIRYLQDQATGYFYHGYNNLTGDHMSGFYWGRANAWAAYTMAMGKRYVNYLYPTFMDMDCSLRDQLAGLKQVQTERGLWHTIVDDEESYEEVSASCGIAAAMIANGNILHTAYVQKALDGIFENLTEDGRVLNVSGGTAVMRDREGYRKVPKKWTQGWGQGLALAFLTQVLTCEQAGINVKKV